MASGKDKIKIAKAVQDREDFNDKEINKLKNSILNQKVYTDDGKIMSTKELTIKQKLNLIDPEVKIYEYPILKRNLKLSNGEKIKLFEASRNKYKIRIVPMNGMIPLPRNGQFLFKSDIELEKTRMEMRSDIDTDLDNLEIKTRRRSDKDKRQKEKMKSLG